MANTMPVKIPFSSLAEDASFGDLVKAFAKSMSSAKRYERYPFIDLADEVTRTKHDEQLDLKVAVTFSPRLADSTCKLYPVEGVWDLFFCFLEQEQGVSLEVISDPYIFDRDALSTLKLQFTNTLERSRQDMTFKLSDLDYIQDRKVATLVSAPAIQQTEEISSARVHKWIKARAAAQPQAIAMTFTERGTSMTYEELACKSSQISRYLQHQGVRPGVSVLLHINRDFNTVLWILGVLEAGACFIVLEKSLPSKRKRAIAHASEASFMVTDETPESESLTLTILHVADAESTMAAYSTTPLTVATANDDLAYIVFTSGSTGEPKGVMVEQSNLSHYVSAARQCNKIGPYSRVLQFATFAFDASILEWAVSLSFGATLCFVEYPQLLVGDYLADVISGSEINFFHTTPSVLSTLSVDKSLPSLRSISVGGEASSAGLLDKWRRKVELLHAYGPTETTVIVTTECIPEDAAGVSDPPSPSMIGKPFVNSQVFIYNEATEEPSPVGSSGEICIVGPQVSRGYKGQEELTRAKFREVHHGGQVQRLYRTGDRGFLGPDGRLSILGRLRSREVKVRGYRVDLYEIEKSILDHCPQVRLASVQVEAESLVAFIAPGPIDCEAVRSRLHSDLPSYSIPSRIVVVDSLPLNSNGKVDHAQVTAQAPREWQKISSPSFMPHVAKHKDGTDQCSKRKPDISSIIPVITETVTKLWMHTLGISTPPAKDKTFYDAGGHSILLTSLHKSLVAQFPTSGLRLLEVFQLPTIEKQVQRISEVIGGNFHVLSSSIEASRTPKPIDQSTASFDDKYAITGMAGYFPGANNIHEFWELLIAQRDGVSTLPSPASDDHTRTLGEHEAFIPRWGAIQGLECFDRKAWNITEAEARTMDPQKLLFLDVASQALKDSHIELSKQDTNNIGIFVGAAANSFQHDPRQPVPESTFEARHRMLLDPSISTFTAYKLNLNGPNLTVNTACSSSLSALHAGLNSLRANDCGAVLIGGTSVVYPQEGGYVTNPGQILSHSGYCRPLDSEADGSVPADAVAAIVIKPLRDAIRDKDRIYSVIEGYGVGTDGSIDKTGFPVPSSEGQSRTVVAAVQSSGANPESIKYVEMHGSGTLLGDALEVCGLDKSFGLLGRHRESKIYIGSNKGNFGNSETASGLLSLIKASIALDKGTVPPLRHLRATNPEIVSGGLFEPLTFPLNLNDEDRIGVTSLGYGGTNTHIVLASRRNYSA